MLKDIFTPAESVHDWWPETFPHEFELGWFITEYKTELSVDGEAIF